MPGVDGDNHALQERFLHESMTLTFNTCPLFADIKKHFSGNRQNGCVQVQIPISKPDWYEIQEFVDMLRKINEGDLIQFCLKYRFEKMEGKGIE